MEDHDITEELPSDGLVPKSVSEPPTPELIPKSSTPEAFPNNSIPEPDPEPPLKAKLNDLSTEIIEQI
ncbi:hypothetical protein HBI56_127450 [Parastagonospora nodorum]|uniref:Uncharacterized protein n=1 Tax=Phaeosphaeria nodorum (strain SN15 / ATCC MYA-4574 / FGSC 10173) TaxID=321614 RepID=A0A7U2F908_PHANO|nr:hypothetical protein HBH56_168820 [Parastagonospora nodorum]QRC98720.1 hypothetical protein JI435_436030 [Parastagonospora nodorum SN15]KAH3936384.1 hypothetical protein HBH54_031910 [Parastagonospora nodorum]KAH3948333.1 hypothetical protein HBH53_106680 [Parastagonospora nodorum]KAH3968657.1 hypothetical protein HBH51_130590 [Parastagonospora nodorum]